MHSHKSSLNPPPPHQAVNMNNNNGREVTKKERLIVNELGEAGTKVQPTDIL